LPVAWIESLYEGLRQCLDRYNSLLLGGDVCRSRVITVSITALGQVAPEQVIRRSTARLGDAILVTGVHGASRAGLELLLHPEVGVGLNAIARHRLIQAHQRPQPRFDVVARLRELNSETSRAIATRPSPMPVAGMDSSDGLANAILQICQASQVGARIERAQMPIPAEFDGWLPPDQALEWALYGGEDFELVLCLPVTMAMSLLQRLGPGAAIIGTITENLEVVMVDTSGQFPDELLTLNHGFQHFG
ncbi:MAG: thiamine-phosphate kinase, partial [Cyanothece sp. SIO1E1]|nr:thiamine-phosphate kinase [Cyanothece sp. SIO1E1]